MTYIYKFLISHHLFFFLYRISSCQTLSLYFSFLLPLRICCPTKCKVCLHQRDEDGPAYFLSPPILQIKRAVKF